jgi:outer membrane protein
MRLSLASVLILLAPVAASAADVAPAYKAPMYSPAPVAGWTVTLGVEGRALPSYSGADSTDFTAFPVFQMRRAGTNAKFRSPRDGFGFGLYETENFRIGPVGKLVRPRKEGDHDDLRGLGDVGWTLEAGLFAEYWWTPWLRTRAEIRNGIGGHHGLVGDLTADAVYKFAPQWTLSGGPRLTLASGSAVDPYFSVDATQALASGLPVYDAKGGVRSYGAGAQLRYEVTPQWGTYVYVEYERLAGDVADSPLVTLRGSPNQTTVGAGITYSFDVALPF